MLQTEVKKGIKDKNKKKYIVYMFVYVVVVGPQTFYNLVISLFGMTNLQS